MLYPGMPPLESEWMLDKMLFSFIQKTVPNLQIDLFATGENHQLPLYVSPNVDPRAVATDAMSLNWNQWQRIYLFLPVNLLMKVLEKLRSYQGKVALVAPMWLKSNWFPLMLELKRNPVILPAPKLTQIVQQKSVCASSWITENLHTV